MLTPLLLALCLAVQTDEKLDETLKTYVRDGMADVERASGRRFVKPPTVKRSNRKDVEAILIRELTPQMGLLMPELAEKERAEFARDSARAYVRILLAKYAPGDDTIHVLPPPEILEPETPEQAANTMRVVVTHELVHALDHQTLKVFDRIGTCKTATDLEILNALLEGHAQHLTRRIFAGRNEEKLFDRYEARILAGPPGQSEGEKLITAVLTQSAKFSYIDGRTFFDGLAKSGKATYVADAFAKPPPDKNGVLHPERFYEPAAAVPAFDVEPAFEAFTGPRKDGWLSQKSEIDESMLKTIFADMIEPKVAEEAMKNLVFAKTLAMTPKAAPGSKVAVLLVARHKDAAAAARFLELSMTLSKARDAKLKEGAIRIVSSETRELKTPGGRTFLWVAKKVAAQGQEVGVQSILSSSGPFHLEIQHSNDETTEDAASKLVDLLWAAIEKPK